MAKKPTRTHSGFKSKAATGKGFKFGIDNMVNASKSAMPYPHLKAGLGSNIQAPAYIRPGIWHPGSTKP